MEPPVPKRKMALSSLNVSWIVTCVPNDRGVPQPVVAVGALLHVELVTLTPGDTLFESMSVMVRYVPQLPPDCVTDGDP